jgi:DNA/RNA-binding domain of Phe-tRNA-synthetase-like protein
VAGRERYTLLSGREQELTAGDMMMADELGVISSVLDGPDSRTRLGPETTSVLFAVYAPQGVGRQAVLDHLGSIRDNVLLVAPEAAVELLAAYP